MLWASVHLIPAHPRSQVEIVKKAGGVKKRRHLFRSALPIHSQSNPCWILSASALKRKAIYWVFVVSALLPDKVISLCHVLKRKQES
jgi:hypothetical protein